MSIENIKDFRNNNVNIFEKTFDNKTSIRIEKGVFNFAISEAKKKNIVRNWDNKYFVKLYMDRLRSIYINLKNKDVIKKIKSRKIKMKELSLMTHKEICPEKWKNLIDAKIKRDKNMTSVDLSAATDEFKCYKCKKRRCTYYQLQTRGADEPMTTFVTCLVCGNRWKC